MGARQRAWARRERDRLLELLGNKCAHCGALEELSFDCKIPMGHEHHAIEWSHRISFYRAQHAAGNLQILCLTCNKSKGNGPTIRTPAAKQAIEARLLELAWDPQ